VDTALADGVRATTLEQLARANVGVHQLSDFVSMWATQRASFAWFTGDTIITHHTPRLRLASPVTNSHREIHVATVTKTAPTTGDAHEDAEESARTVHHGLLVDVDGTFDTVDLAPDQNGRCGAAIRKHLGCSRYDLVAATDEIDMWIDDEGIVDLSDVDEVNAALNLRLRGYSSIRSSALPE
jgi:hypothetical protein